MCLELTFHADYADVKEKIKIIRDLNEYGYTTALSDLQGPKLRVELWAKVVVNDGDLITFTTAEDILGTAKKYS
jgi:pyruvate kinase